MVNLMSKMQKLVDKYVKHYKIDFDFDKNTLHDNDLSNNVFYWYLRESGTQLLREDRVFFKGDSDNHTALTMGKHARKAYKVVVEKRCIKNIYGTITEIDVSKFLETIKNNPKNYRSMNVKVMYQNGKTEDLTISREDEQLYNNAFYAILHKLHKAKKISSEDDIKEWKLIDYEAA